MKSTANKCLISSLVLCFALTSIISITGCSVDAVIGGLQTADAVAQSAIAILAPVNAPMAAVMSKVDVDLQTVVKVYKDYDSAVPEDKATKADLVKATVGAIRGNLSAILADVSVKNPGLLRDVNIAVAVVNSALVIALQKVNGTTAQAAIVGGGPELPIIVGAKSAKDLKKAWNDAIKADFPKAVVK